MHAAVQVIEATQCFVQCPQVLQSPGLGAGPSAAWLVLAKGSASLRVRRPLNPIASRATRVSFMICPINITRFRRLILGWILHLFVLGSKADCGNAAGADNGPAAHPKRRSPARGRRARVHHKRPSGLGSSHGQTDAIPKWTSPATTSIHSSALYLGPAGILSFRLRGIRYPPNEWSSAGRPGSGRPLCRMVASPLLTQSGHPGDRECSPNVRRSLGCRRSCRC